MLIDVKIVYFVDLFVLSALLLHLVTFGRKLN